MHPNTTMRAVAGPHAITSASAAPRRAAGGERDSATALQAVERDRWALVRFARRITGCHEDAEDAVQAACLIAVRRPDIVGPTAIAWLLTVIRHEAYRRRAAALRGTGASDDVTPARTGIGHPLAAPDHDVDALLDLRAALAACSPDELVALLGRVAGHSYAEIGARHGWTQTKVNRCLSEGRARVRARLAA